MAIEVGTYVARNGYDGSVGKVLSNKSKGPYGEIKYEVYFYSPKQIEGLEILDDSEFTKLLDADGEARMAQLTGGSRKSRRRSRKNKRTRRVRR